MRFIQDIIAEKSRNQGAHRYADAPGRVPAAGPDRPDHASDGIASDREEDSAAIEPDAAPPADGGMRPATDFPDDNDPEQHDPAAADADTLFGQESEDELAEEDDAEFESIFDSADDADFESPEEDDELATLIADAQEDDGMPAGAGGLGEPSRKEAAHESGPDASERQGADGNLRNPSRHAYFASPEQRLDEGRDAERGSDNPLHEDLGTTGDEGSSAPCKAAAGPDRAEYRFNSPDRVAMPKPSAGRGSARSGRMKTRLLGFSAPSAEQGDPFKETETSAMPYSSFPVGWLIVVAGPGRGSAFTIFHGITTIGRGQDQKVRLDFGDNSISRENHAAIAYDPEQQKFFLGHGGKANLVRLNDRPVLSTEELRSESHIRIGETELRFVALCGEAFSWTEGQEDTTRHAFGE